MTWRRLGRDADHLAGIARVIDVPDGPLYVFCSGTSTKREWRLNFQTRQMRALDRARVNRADWQQAQAVYSAMLEAGVQTHSRDVRVAGYSRGYAIALLLPWLLSTSCNTDVVGFAGKRVGNKAFHKHMIERNVGHSNLCYRYDIVPGLPPWYAKGPEFWIKRSINPFKAHLAMAHTAAMWRHEISTISKGDVV